MSYFAFVSYQFTEESESKMRKVQSLQAGEHFDAKNWAFDAKFAEMERGQNCCEIFAGKQASFLVSYYTCDTTQQT